MKSGKKQLEEITKKEDKVKPCLKCGHPVSIYYFTTVTTDNGKVIQPRCSNCGFFEDPE